MDKRSKKKELTVEDRVGILLREGIEHPERWMPVHDYVEPDDYTKHDGPNGEFNEMCFDALRDHHLAETKALFEIIEELVRRYDRLLDLYTEEGDH